MFVLLMLVGVWILGVEPQPNASVILSIFALGLVAPLVALPLFLEWRGDVVSRR